MKIFTAVFCILCAVAFASGASTADDLKAYLASSTYPFRDISKPIIQDSRFKKIVILSTPRVGSTLLYMIFQYLFENQLEDHLSWNKKVIKTTNIESCLEHLFYHENTLVVVPVRNPLDAFCSMAKISECIGAKDTMRLLRSTIQSHLDLKKVLDRVEKKRLLLFKYEEFNDDFSVIFDELQNRFHMKISDGEKEKIRGLFSKDAVRNYYKDYQSLLEYDPILGVHGDHISSDKRTLHELFPKKIVEEIHRQFAPVLPLFGY